MNSLTQNKHLSIPDEISLDHLHLLPCTSLQLTSLVCILPDFSLCLHIHVDLWESIEAFSFVSYKNALGLSRFSEVCIFILATSGTVLIALSSDLPGRLGRAGASIASMLLTIWAAGQDMADESGHSTASSASATSAKPLRISEPGFPCPEDGE